MTALEKLLKANRWRIRSASPKIADRDPVERSRIASEDQDGWNGWFLVPLEGELWQVCLSDGMGWRHLSATNAQKKQLPPWRVMCRLKDSFFGDDAWVVQFHPPKEVYVDDHPYCLHLWESIEDPMPTPSIVQV